MLVVLPKIELLRIRVKVEHLISDILVRFKCTKYLMLTFYSVQVTSFIHRMVDTLGASVFPYLPKALEQLLSESEVQHCSIYLIYFSLES